MAQLFDALLDPTFYNYKKLINLVREKPHIHQ
jgi:hypothetical protein